MKLNNCQLKISPFVVFLFLIPMMILAFLVVINGEENFTFQSEPEVRIGVVQRTIDTNVEFNSAYKALTFEGKILWLGKPDTLRILRQEDNTLSSPPQYRIEIGKYKSYERANSVSEKIKPLGYPVKPAHPENWMVWVGPFSTMSQAAAAWGELQSMGIRNAMIIKLAMPILRVVVLGSGGELKYSGAEGVVFTADSGVIKYGSGTYHGGLEARPDAYGSLTLINLVKVEDYLRGVVSGEMPASSPIEALKAQTIIARTYLMKNLNRHRVDSFNLCAAPDCQVYRGIGGETDQTDAAVKATRGLALMYNNAPANPLFHSTCGGKTAAYNDVWPGSNVPYLTAVNDGAPVDHDDLSAEADFQKFLASKSANCSRSKYFRWEVKKTKTELDSILAKTLPDYTGNPTLKPGALRTMRILRRNPSGRVGEIEIITEHGDYRFSGDEIRWVLGGLRSTMFTVSGGQDTNSEMVYTFYGAGWGHGVGLCQMGAIALAKDGMAYKQILTHYYPGTKIYTAW